tara:strand:+ start:869 stop:1159 length:291 start_codon:yes stop_codon:yes gene_type:complete
MTKNDIVNKVAGATGLTKVETEAVLEGILSTIVEAMSKGNRVDIRGFGSFLVKKKDSREARNPATNEIIFLKERYVPSFKVSKLLKEKVDKSLTSF